MLISRRVFIGAQAKFPLECLSAIVLHLLRCEAAIKRRGDSFRGGDLADFDSPRLQMCVCARLYSCMQIKAVDPLPVCYAILLHSLLMCVY